MPPFRTILVLCEGNHCRSPLAEGLLRQALGPRVQVASAGLRAQRGQPADPEIRRLMAQAGVPIETHRSRDLDPDLARGADLVLVMDQAQRALCIQRFPFLRGRTFLLGHWLPEDRQEIPDPFQRGPETMKATMQHVREALAAWIPRLSGE
jgi:protein-tyrosine phosphatase